MKSKKSLKMMRRGFLIALSVTIPLVFMATSAFALFTNGGFENENFTGWTKASFINPGLSGSQPFTGASIVRDAGGIDDTNILGPYTAMSQADSYTGNILHYPRFGSYCAVINYLGSNNNANSLKQQTSTAEEDVQSDGKIHIQFAWAAVVQNPSHADNEQPYIYVSLKNVTKGNALLYETFILAGSGSIRKMLPVVSSLLTGRL